MKPNKKKTTLALFGKPALCTQPNTFKRHLHSLTYLTTQNMEDYEEEETLSLCDLPVSASNEETPEKIQTKPLETEDFDFGSLGGTVLMESEMCTADEVFFKGQILPQRLSVTSVSRNPSSRSESLEHSLSSRSNSIGSHNSTSTISTISTTSSNSTYKPKFRNQFHSHSHPSPKPQIVSVPRPGHMNNRCRKSTIWSIFKVGVVRTPEMELQELKIRNSRCSSSSSSRKSGDLLVEIKPEEKTMKKKKTERFMFDGCQCSADAVDTVILLKSKKKEEEDKVEKGVTDKQRKQAMHHRRTFEWLKDLSIADVPQEL